MVYLVKTEARQRCTPGEKGMGVPPSEEEHSKEMVKTFNMSILLGLWLPADQLSGTFSIPDLPWDPPLGTYTPLSQEGS